MQALRRHASRGDNLSLLNQGLPSVWAHNPQHSTYTEKLQKYQATIEYMAAAGGTISWRRTYEFKRGAVCAVYLRPWEHSHETRSTSNGQLRVGCYTCSDTISYMPKKRQLSEYEGTAMTHARVLWIRFAFAGVPQHESHRDTSCRSNAHRCCSLSRSPYIIAQSSLRRNWQRECEGTAMPHVIVWITLKHSMPICSFMNAPSVVVAPYSHSAA